MDIPFVAKVPHTREIYRIDFRLGYADIAANASPGNVNDRTGLPAIGGGDDVQTTTAKRVGDLIQTGGISSYMNAHSSSGAGTAIAYFDQIYFDVDHPDHATDREGSIRFSSLSDVTLTSSHFEGGTIDGTLITGGSIDTPQISTDYIYANTVNASQITAGSITVGVNIGDSAPGQAPGIFIDGATGRIIIRD
jgi:hypothetical protein